MWRVVLFVFLLAFRHRAPTPSCPVCLWAFPRPTVVSICLVLSVPVFYLLRFGDLARPATFSAGTGCSLRVALSVSCRTPGLRRKFAMPLTDSFPLSLELARTSFPSLVAPLLWVRPFQQSRLFPGELCSHGATLWATPKPGGASLVRNVAFSSLDSSCTAGPGPPGGFRGHLTVCFP